MNLNIKVVEFFQFRKKAGTTINESMLLSLPSVVLGVEESNDK